MNKNLTLTHAHAALFKLVREFRNRTGSEPLYVNCMIRFKDDNSTIETTIKLNNEMDENDDKIFFYCNGLAQFKSLMQQENGEDFLVVDVFSVEGEENTGDFVL